ncbi:MAG: GTP cyclohydrolase I FolE [Alphaproteobacteria bacterium]|nr:GTP cyclohydrolase I FolE [Alphaproteobacteria bacterium]
MDAIVKNLSLGAGPDVERPSLQEAEDAVRTLIAWAGDDPTREGLQDTPKRVVNAYREFFKGYEECPLDVLSRTFEEVGGYDDIVLLRDIDLNSHCEHHMIPFIGVAHVAYFPTDRVVGISKLARVVEIYARRLQTQETMTAQILGSIETALAPKGTAVMIDAVHQCMSLRGIQKRNVSTITTQFSGEFKTNPALQARFLELVRGASRT